ncbi:hypothetical protein VNO80_13312 [Phaseolus coccineus]|uniref:Uncharacterized protein n=1 Tax=Phaseolus coccineus TaxID=3886 RepID=A0AAN9N0Q8_PHACN
MRLRDLRCQERFEVSSSGIRNLALSPAASPPTGDNTIDALDVGEEEQEDAIDAEADDDEGMIHWAINKSSFMDDEDEGPFVGPEDVGMTVFGSDDVAVEEKVKSKFLRKEKMLRSGLEGLNPLCNPIIQDPDVLGVTGITKADKIIRNSIVHDLKNLPFPSRKITHSSNF